MISFRTQSETTLDVCEDLTNVCGFFDFPDDQVAIVNEHAVVNIPFGENDAREFLEYLQKAAKDGAWPEIPENTEKSNWWAYLDLIEYFDLKQPFLDQAIVKFFTYLHRTARWGGTSTEPGVFYEVWLDRVVDMAIRASRDHQAFPLTWSAFREEVFKAAIHWAHCPDHEFQDLRYQNTFEWMQLVRHSRWQELATPDMMTDISFALTRKTFERRVRLPSKRVCMVEAALDIDDLAADGVYEVQLNDAFKVRVRYSDLFLSIGGARLMIVAQKQVGTVEVSGTISLKGSINDEMQLRFMYYPKDNVAYDDEGQHPYGVMYVTGCTIPLHSKIHFKFSLQFTFLHA